MTKNKEGVRSVAKATKHSTKSKEMCVWSIIVATMLLGIKSVYWCYICKENAFVGWAPELSSHAFGLVTECNCYCYGYCSEIFGIFNDVLSL